MTSDASCRTAIGLLLAGLALGGRLGAQAPAAGEGATRTVLRPVTSFWQHLEEGRFRGRSGVFYDRTGDEIWVADSGNDLVAAFTRDGLPLYTARPGDAVRGPRRIVAHPGGRLLVLVEDFSRIEALDWRGRHLGPLALPGMPEAPQFGALALDEHGNLYVGENSTGEIVVYDPSLRVRARFGRRGDGPGEFQAISGIAARGGRIVVTDLRATCVQVFDRGGNYEFGFGARQIGPENFALPQSVALDSRGRIFVVDSFRHEIKLFDEKGRFLARFGGMGSGPGQVFAPTDLSIDGEDRLYVAEGARIQVLEPVEVPLSRRGALRPARRTREPGGG
jgi:DNA-binding beta-propeller fold protein YncE